MAKDLDEKVSYIQGKVEEVADLAHKIDKEVALQKSAFDEHLKQDERMYEEFKRMNDILQQNTDSLKEHMHRTEVAEQQLAILENLAKEMDARLAPFEKQKIEEEAVAKYRNDKLIKFGKILAAIATLIGILVSLKGL